MFFHGLCEVQFLSFPSLLSLLGLNLWLVSCSPLSFKLTVCPPPHPPDSAFTAQSPSLTYSFLLRRISVMVLDPPRGHKELWLWAWTRMVIPSVSIYLIPGTMLVVSIPYVPPHPQLFQILEDCSILWKTGLKSHLETLVSKLLFDLLKNHTQKTITSLSL